MGEEVQGEHLVQSTYTKSSWVKNYEFAVICMTLMFTPKSLRRSIKLGYCAKTSWGKPIKPKQIYKHGF